MEDTGEQFEGTILGIYVLCALVLSFFLKRKLKHQPAASLIFSWDEEIGAVPLNSMKLLCLMTPAALVVDLSQYFQLSWVCPLPLDAIQCVFDFNKPIALCLSCIDRSSLGRCLVNTINYIYGNEGPKPPVLIRITEMVFCFLIVQPRGSCKRMQVLWAFNIHLEGSFKDSSDLIILGVILLQVKKP